MAGGPVDLRVVDRSTGIAGAYCTRLLADAGAEVVKVEPPGGDPLRGWRSGGLFEFLAASKHSVVGDDDELVVRADVVVTNEAAEVKALTAAHPHLVVVSITPFGASGPEADRPATEFTLQALCGSMAGRGVPERSPLPAGGQLGEWLGGTYAAIGALAAARWARAGAGGRHVDVALLDCMTIGLTIFPTVMASFFGWPETTGTGRSVEVPSIEPTADGYVNFTTNSAQQFEDFLVLIGHAELVGDQKLARAGERFSRRDEFLAMVHAYTAVRTSEVVLEEAGRLRIPAGPVLNGADICDFEQFSERSVYERAASGRFRQPRVPYSISGLERPSRGTSPEVGADTGRVAWTEREGVSPAAPAGARPLSGLRVIDLTAWWAGPGAANALACLGADVVKVESTPRPDLMRFASARSPKVDHWWEWSWIFQGANTSKRGVTLDLTRSEGRDLLERMLRQADLVIENYTPRVMEQFDLGWERVHALNPQLIMVRMPAFGLGGPWRDRTGFAQTMEAMSGMAWVTGYADGGPILPRGVCDPLSGMHAVMASLVALAARDQDGQGRMVESVMVEAALTAAAEQVIEHDTTGTVLSREGTRGPGAPQGLYPGRGTDEWLAVAVADDRQWQALRALAGWGDDDRMATAEGRRRHHDELDAWLAEWSADQDPETAAARLTGVGVPAARVVPGRELLDLAQLQHRRLFERVNHPVIGEHALPGLPFRLDGIDAWLTRPSPTLGQHNDEVLGEVAGPDELATLREAGVIGERPDGL